MAESPRWPPPNYLKARAWWMEFDAPRKNKLEIERRLGVPRWWTAIALRCSTALESTWAGTLARIAGPLALPTGGLVIAQWSQPRGVLFLAGSAGFAVCLTVLVVVILWHICRGLRVDVARPGPPYPLVFYNHLIAGRPPIPEYAIVLPDVRIVSHENRHLALVCHIELRSTAANDRFLMRGISDTLPNGVQPMSSLLMLEPYKDAQGAMAFLLPGSEHLMNRLRSQPNSGIAVRLTVRDKRSGKAVKNVRAGDIFLDGFPPLPFMP